MFASGAVAVEQTIADDSRWGVPLRLGDAFVVRDVRIDAYR
ncbi:MAG: hypothetical protein QF717_14425 [SAR202 cluster bacterium]|nr:hypothetical protein [SAR202 cluster bacterium]